MNTDQKFVVFCAKRCLPLWKAPQEVIEWLNNPEEEDITKSVEEAITRTPAFVALEAEAAARSAYNAIHTKYPEAAVYAAYAVFHATSALNTSVNDLKQEFMSTLSDEDLSVTDDPDWMGYITVEIFNRATTQ